MTDWTERYAEVVLPLPLNATFTYRVPDHITRHLKQGCRVIVPFGAKKYYTGIVVAINNIKPKDFEVKDVLMALDEQPVLRYPQLKFWQWVADYYMSSLGDVYKAAIPAGLKVESETFVEMNPDFSLIEDEINERERIFINELMQHERMTIAELSKATGLRNVEAMASRLLDRGLVIISEKLVERYRSRKEAMVRLGFNPADADAQAAAFEAVKGARKQETLLMAMLELTRPMRAKGEDPVVSRASLLDRSGVTQAVLTALAKKGVVEPFVKEVNRFAFHGTPTRQLPQLTQAQLTALDSLHEQMSAHDVTLLHGVTSSGKTELYIHLIDYALKRGDQVLMLVPEIALTTQLTTRLQHVFGERVVIYHSRFTDNERVDIWRRLLESDEPCVVLGARSSLFMPFARLGLVIVDEEHESSYKQFDPAPRYNARDAAIVLASMHGAKTILGSATPAVETYYKTEQGRWGRVSLSERYDGATLPHITVIDMLRARQAGVVSGAFATDTAQAVTTAINNGKQAILFHNRRGYSPMVRCRQCGWIPKCEHCDVSLTVHRQQGHLVCHYCGSLYNIPTTCPQCREAAIDTIGYGTERVEEEVAERFPNARMLRMDLDSTRSKDAYASIINDFSQHKADILVGTQMVTKGLDFGDVSVVGALNADSIINFPDFRSAERAFCMLSQVAGRAGRRGENPGSVIIQTAQPSHPVINFVQRHDYQGFYNHEIEERRLFLYPPFTRMIYIYMRHRDPRILDDIANKYGDYLRTLFGTRVFGPEEPAIGRIQSLYIRKIMLKVEVEASMKRAKAILRDAQQHLLSTTPIRGLLIHYDVDPY